ncbi:hypothetical protein CDL12_05682 [Handroanthus impetiginosus]|uniref:F-box domain-containing protein n=1 Tax=Handroanthus impetiginosus TaxID=429701 RepID=A0A2G9HVV8_9LAMI|nr:hypothetical protein CDL12_05682 [Handroanthus impetiginosus]
MEVKSSYMALCIYASFFLFKIFNSNLCWQLPFGKNLSKRLRFEKKTCLCDRLSELPDEILVSILSLLSLKEAAKTSIPSRRWRYLWTFFIGNMVFNDDEWRINWPQFVTRANQIMKLHKGMSIQGFKVAFDNVPLVEDIDHWIEFVAKKRATEFHLTFGSKKSCSPETFTRIRLQPPSTDWNFESLKIVSLSRVSLTEAVVVNYFLSNAPDLEKLHLRDLVGLSELVVPSSCLKLKFLFVIRCDHLRKVEIFARSIEEFHCDGPGTNILIKDLHQLRDFWFADRDNTLRTLFDLMTYLYRIIPMHQLETLGLDLWTRKQQLPLDVKQFCLPKLHSLELVIVPCQGVELLSWMYLLEAAPVLHTLKIVFAWEYGFIQGLSMFDMHKMHLNRCIKVVQVIHFLGLPDVDTQVVKTVIKYMESLEKLIIVPYEKVARLELPTFTDGMKKQMNRSIAQLCEKDVLPPKVELVIECKH